MSEWSEILEKAESIYENNWYRKPWFRGHNNTNYSLNSSLYRNNSSLSFKSYEINEFYFFKNYGESLFEFMKLDDWSIVFTMQHHGMKTRLLDWSDSFGVALYFANLNRNEEEDACIWALNPTKLNYKASEILGGPPKDTLYSIDKLPDTYRNYQEFLYSDKKVPSIALVPRRNTSRLLTQQGNFTLQGTFEVPLEEEFSDLVNSEDLIKIELPSSTYEQSIRFLKMNGINHFSLFPDLDGLSYFIISEKLRTR